MHAHSSCRATASIAFWPFISQGRCYFPAKKTCLTLCVVCVANIIHRHLYSSPMGNPISKIRQEATKAADEEEQAMQQRLQILEKMVTARLDNENAQVLAGERNDQEIHAGTIVQIHRQINITDSAKESQKISDAIHNFFSGDLIAGLETVVEFGAEAVLGNESMGEYETTDMFIVWSSNALLRCDAYYYRWNFVSKSVIDKTEGVVGVFLMKRVIDITKTDPQVLTWAITQQANRGKQDPGKAVDDAMTVLEKVVAFQAKLKQIEAGSSTGGGKHE